MNRHTGLRSLVGLLLLGALAALPACSSIRVKSDWDPEVDFSRFHTWDFGPTHVPVTEEGKLVNDGLIDGRVRRALENVLPEHGLDRVGDAPDLRVSFFLVVKDKVNVTTINNSYGYGPGWGPVYGYGTGWGYGPGGFGSQTVVDQYQQGTLVIDLTVHTDTGTKLVWRGSGSARLREGERTPEESQARILEAVAEIMKRYPPSS